MKFGMLHLFESPMGRTDHEMVQEQVALMEAAEDLGFDSLWPAEHHLSEGSPRVFLSDTNRSLAMRLRVQLQLARVPGQHHRHRVIGRAAARRAGRSRRVR